MLKTAILGPVYTPDDPHHVAYLQDALVEINQTGKIIAVLTPNDADYQGHLRQAQAAGRLTKTNPRPSARARLCGPARPRPAVAPGWSRPR